MISLPIDPDDELDASIPQAPSAPVPTPAAAKPATPAGRIGKVGVTAWVPLTRLAAFPNGLSRTRCPETVVYQAPPPEVRVAGCEFRWLESNTPAGRLFEMPLADEVWSRAISLSEWRERLAALGPDPDPREPAAAEVDGFARRLLDLTEALHAHEWRLGLVDPTNLYVVQKPGVAPTLILLDLGFVWLPDGNPPWTDVLSRPTWLQKQAEFAAINPDPAACQQLSFPDAWKRHLPYVHATHGNPVPDPGRLSDLKLVARLFAYLLTGTVGSVTLTPARNGAWGILVGVESGRVTSATEFRRHLAATPLSEQLFPLPEAPEELETGKKPRGWQLPGVIGVALLASAGGGIWLYLNSLDQHGSVGGSSGNSNSSTSGGTITPPPAESAAVAAIQKFEQATTFTEQLAAAESLQDAKPTSPASQTFQATARQRLRADWFKQYERLCQEAAAGDRDPGAVAEQMRQLLDDLQRIRKLPPVDANTQVEERRWLEHCAQFAF